MEIILNLIILTTAIHAKEPFEIINTETKKNIHLSSEIQSTLKKWDPYFKVVNIEQFPKAVIELFKDSKNELPMSVIGDFNGDKRQDVALMGLSQKSERIIILVAQQKNYQVVELQTRVAVDPKKTKIILEDGEQFGFKQYLSLFSSADVKAKKNKSYLAIPDLLQIEVFLGLTKAYYLKPNSKKSFDVKEFKGQIE